MRRQCDLQSLISKAEGRDAPPEFARHSSRLFLAGGHEFRVRGA